MCKIKTFSCIVLLISFCDIIKSQPLTIDENQRAHRRYWFYRTRMINDFMKVGGGQGNCIVLAERNQGRNDVTAKVGADQIDITNQYLSALALEYKLLTRNNQNTDETIKEIFYLIKTLNRLDSRADWFFQSSPPLNDNMTPYPETAYLNGFMLREDMPLSFIQNNLSHYNYELLEAGYNGSSTSLPNPLNTYKSFTGLNHISNLDNDNQFSSFIGFRPDLPEPKKLNRMTCPQDKYFSMFVALMFINKYIPDGTYYYENGVKQQFQDYEYDIKQEVRNIANRCHPYLRGNLFGSIVSDWRMEYPDGTHNSEDLGILPPFSYPVTRMICHINRDFPWSLPPCIAYSDFVAQSNRSVYQNMQFYLPFGALYSTGQDAAVFLANCQAGSNVGTNMLPAWIIMQLNTAAYNLEWADLLRMVLHENGNLTKSKGVYANPINSAPCEGPYNFNHLSGEFPLYTGSTFDDAGYEWSSQDRMEHPDSRGSMKPFPGNYPGVDYMLLHNLYYEYLNQQDDKPSITEDAAYKNAYNFMDNEDNSIWPKKIILGFVGMTLGVNNTDGNHQLGNVKVFQYLKSTAHIYAATSPLAPVNTVPSNVTYRAGKEIALQPGFQVEAGSTFHAYIKRYVCGVDDYTSGMRTAKDSTDNNMSNDYEGDAMNDIPLHYVEYPKSNVGNYPYLPDELETSETINQIDKNEVKITPNPSTGIFSVEAKKTIENEILSLRVYDLLGNLIIELNDVSVKTEINLKNYSKGVYMVHILSNLGNNYVKKVSIVE